MKTFKQYLIESSTGQASDAVNEFLSTPEANANGLSIDVGVETSNKSIVALSNIDVDLQSRGTGIASAALTKLTSIADKYNVPIELEVGSDDAEINTVEWYARHGFKWHDGFMRREPNDENV